VDLVEHLLGPDEPVLFSGRASGRPRIHAVVHAGILFLAVALSCCLGPKGTLPSGVVGYLFLIPFLGGAVLGAAIELYRFAAWRARRTVVTTRRVLVVGGVFRERVLGKYLRSGTEKVSVAEGGLVIRGLGGDRAVLLGGLDPDAAPAIEHAIATFDPTPPAPFPPPFWNWRRKLALALLLLLTLAAAIYAWAGPNRVTLEAVWTHAPGTGVDKVSVAVDGPAFGRHAVYRVWLNDRLSPAVFADGVAVMKAGGSGGGSKGRMMIVRDACDAWGFYKIPATARRVRVEGEVEFLDAPSVAFSLELEPDTLLRRALELAPK
jgi:hypothetical protein